MLLSLSARNNNYNIPEIGLLFEHNAKKACFQSKKTQNYVKIYC